MENKNEYVDINTLLVDNYEKYTKVVLGMPIPTVISKGVIIWCSQNVHGKWLMLSPTTFLFEHGEEATNFAIRFI